MTANSTRRRILKTGSAALAAALAGCGGAPSGETEDGGATTTSEGDGGPTPTETAGGTATPTGTGTGERPTFPAYLDDARTNSFEDLRGESGITVRVGGGEAQLSFVPTKAWIDPGTTITFEWVSSGHNVTPNTVPSGSDWSGFTNGLESEGFTHEHTFETTGIYTYYCEPHEGAGMKGGIAVGGDPSGRRR